MYSKREWCQFVINIRFVGPVHVEYYVSCSLVTTVMIANGGVDLNDISPESVQVSVFRHEELFCFGRRTSLPLLTEVRYVPLDQTHTPHIPQVRPTDCAIVDPKLWRPSDTRKLKSSNPMFSSPIRTRSWRSKKKATTLRKLSFSRVSFPIQNTKSGSDKDLSNRTFGPWPRNCKLRRWQKVVLQDLISLFRLKVGRSKKKSYFSAPDVPITSNFTYEMFPLLDGNYR